MFEESEIVDLLMALLLTPIIWLSFRTLKLPGKTWFLFGYFVIMVAYACTVAEGYVLPDLFNALEHIGYALAGAGFAGGAWSMLVESRRAAQR